MIIAILLSATACAAAGGALGYAWPHLRERRRARRTQRQLGRPREHLDARLDQQVVTLRGVLHSDGAGPAVVTTSRFPADPLAMTSRSARVQVKIGEDLVEVEGPLEVLVGSEEFPTRLSSELALESRLATRRVLRAGDPVVVRARLRAGHGDFSGYRSSKTQWTMRPPRVDGDDQNGTISVASSRVPRQHGAHLPLILAGAIAGASLYSLGFGVTSVLQLPVSYADASSALVAATIPARDPEKSQPRVVISRRGIGPLAARTTSDLLLLRHKLAGFYVREVPWPRQVDGTGHERYLVADHDGDRVMLLEAGMHIISRAEIFSGAVKTRGHLGVGSRLAALFAAHPDTICRRDRWREVAPGFGDTPPLGDVVICSAASLPRLSVAVRADAAKAWQGDRGQILAEEELAADAPIVRMAYDLL